jgi:hypothetical protein
MLLPSWAAARLVVEWKRSTLAPMAAMAEDEELDDLLSNLPREFGAARTRTNICLNIL